MCRFFRFTIRDLLWLTLVVAIATGWFVRERRLGAEVVDAQHEATVQRWYVKVLEEAVRTRDQAYYPYGALPGEPQSPD